MAYYIFPKLSYKQKNSQGATEVIDYPKITSPDLIEFRVDDNYPLDDEWKEVEINGEMFQALANFVAKMYFYGHQVFYYCEGDCQPHQLDELYWLTENQKNDLLKDGSIYDNENGDIKQRDVRDTEEFTEISWKIKNFTLWQFQKTDADFITWNIKAKETELKYEIFETQAVYQNQDDLYLDILDHLGLIDKNQQPLACE